MAVFTILYGNYYPPQGNSPDGLEWISPNSMGKIARGDNKINLPCCMAIVATFL